MVFYRYTSGNRISLCTCLFLNVSVGSCHVFLNIARQFQGILYPAIHCVVALWSPIEEKGKFVACLLGGALGTVITWSMVGYIIENVGWIWAFYIPAIITALVSFIWLYIVADSPQTHPRISDNERLFIQKSQEGQVTTKKVRSFLFVCTLYK